MKNLKKENAEKNDSDHFPPQIHGSHNKSNLISPKFARESIYSVSWLFVFRITGIISSIIIANILLQQQYGIYSVLNSWGLVLNYICSMGVPIAAAKIISSNRSQNPENNYSLFVNMIIINSINIAGVYIFSILTLNFFTHNVYNVPFFEVGMFESLILLTAFRASIFALYSLQQGIATGYREFKAIAIVFIIGYSLKIPILYILTTNFQLYGAWIAEILTESIIFSLFLMFLTSFFRKNNIKFEWKIQKDHLKDLYNLGIPAFLSNLIFIAVFWFGLTTLSNFYSFAEVGTFQTSLNIVNLIFIVPYGIISPFLPEITEKFEMNSGDFHQTMYKVMKIIVLITLPLIVFVGFFSPFLIQVFYPRYFQLITFYSSYILLSYIFINSFTLVFFYTFISMGKSRILITLEAFKAASFFILILLLVPTHGIVGLAYVYFISFLIYALIYQIVSIKYDFKFYPYPYILVAVIFFGFVFYSIIFSYIDISSPIWILSSVFISAITTSICISQLWRDPECKNFIESILSIFKRNSLLE